ncbi:MAG TPA: hypothetical protein QGF05_09920, partial [Dehalococcoidia bacterium]|nr:hypothetical protein [Dehalococcoidia bacterium]
SDTLGIVTGLAQAVGLTGLTCAGRSDRRPRVHEGVVHVSDALDVLAVDVPAAWRGRRLRRHVRSFFQGNRYLLGRLVSSVASRVSEPEVWDLYAGVGLFAVGVAVSTGARVTAVEHDPFCAADLTANAAPFGETLTVVRSTVERFLRSSKRRAVGCLIVDPPRVGLTRDAVAGILRCRVPLMIYVSCDPPTFARDVKRLLDGGYRLDSLEAFDLFPNTAHVEIVASLRLTSATEPRNP